MSYVLSSIPNTNIISVKYDETTSYADRVNLLNELVGILEQSPQTNIVIDTRNANKSMTNREELAYGELLATKSKYFNENRTAIITNGQNPHPLIQAQAYVTGFKNMIECLNMTEARQWVNREIN